MHQLAVLGLLLVSVVGAQRCEYPVTIPPGITIANRITLKGTHGEVRIGYTLNPNDQRGSIVNAYGVAVGGKTLQFFPGSFYGRTSGAGGGMPADTSGRGSTWARGGAASAMFGGAGTVIAAGGGGQGSEYIGGDADRGGCSVSTQEGGFPDTRGGGGGGPGLNGGCGGAYTYTSSSTCSRRRTCFGCSGFDYYPCNFVDHFTPSLGGTSGATSFTGSWGLSGYNTDPSSTNRLIEIEFLCGAPVPTTTITIPTPAATEYTTSTLTLPATATLDAETVRSTLTVESARPPEYTDTTVTPDLVTLTESETSTTYPPESTTSETVTPSTSYFTEYPSVETTPATSTVYKTVTPATVTVTKTESVTVSPGTVLKTETTTPPTRTIPTTVTEEQTKSSGTLTSTVTSATGNANCVQFRMVYPASCCPTAYIKGMKPWPTSPRKRRNLVFGRDLTTIYPASGTLTITESTQTTATSFVTPDPVLVTDTETTPGPITTLTNTFTAETPTSTLTEVSTVEGVASTTTITLTADAPSFTYTSTQYFEAPTPLFTDVSTADAPLVTETSTAYSTLPTPTSTVKEEAPTPLTTSTSTLTNFRTVPAATATTTTYPQDYSYQIVQIALIKTNRFLSGNKPVQIDCGSAGLWSYE
ncbi:hypothetical protein Rhopal_002514-T1 [Rhodotorula paludigena]|uniref:Uncharacterized protein n=1 Tax=Rhodotorula paludigena TaxID=86838 RepID=A0AAV5GKF4_9BASI|nr:hypothetical protein Rhopal_002514-T1 [Rhodotorula paludigena]